MADCYIVRRGGTSVEVDMPSASYTGSWSGFINDGVSNGVQNWRAKFFTSGILTFKSNISEVDVFLVGGGGSATTKNSGAGGGNGGGGGYTLTQKYVPVTKGTQYEIVIGAGGAANSSYSTAINGNPSSAFGYTAEGGKGGDKSYGGAGGSGGGGGYNANGDGGSDGSKGGGNSSGAYSGGTGQTGTTREFGEATGELYAGGGGGSTSGKGGAGGGGNAGTPGVAGVSNTGGGGGAGNTSSSTGGAGGSGIVIIRNCR